jgi:hypothetical protein
MEVVSAEEVCEYTYKVEWIELNKISVVVFNTTTGIKYQTYIEEYSDVWDGYKVNFQTNFSLFHKMISKGLQEKDPAYHISLLHKIDYVIVQFSYPDDLFGFTIDIRVNQYKKDNLQETVNILGYKHSQLESENSSLKEHIQRIDQELTELKRIINLLGDSFSYDNALRDPNCTTYPYGSSRYIHTSGPILLPRTATKGVTKTHNLFSACHESHAGAGGMANVIVLPFSTVTGSNHVNVEHMHFLTKDVVNKLIPIVFTHLVTKHNLDYDIAKEGYNWTILKNMCDIKGIPQQEWSRSIPQYIMDNYDLTWKSFKELFDITI